MILQLLTTACDNYMALQYDWMEFGNTNQLSVLLTVYSPPPPHFSSSLNFFDMSATDTQI